MQSAAMHTSFGCTKRSITLLLLCYERNFFVEPSLMWGGSVFDLVVIFQRRDPMRFVSEA